MPLNFRLGVNSISKHDPQWKHKTTERYRIDEHSLDILYNEQTNLKCHQAIQSATSSLKTLLSRIELWVRNVLLKSDSEAPLRMTRHVMQRLDEYENRMSRCGRFVELYSDEKSILQRLPQHLSAQTDFKVVEVGLNAAEDVCKIALLVPLDQLMRKNTHRKLFLLVGCDGGVKSMYVVSGLKKRNRYRAKGDIVQVAVQTDLTLKYDEHL